MGFRTLEWRDGALWLLDQRKLPGQVEEVRSRSAAETARAIRAGYPTRLSDPIQLDYNSTVRLDYPSGYSD